jgi:hypothetical protein
MLEVGAGGSGGCKGVAVERAAVDDGNESCQNALGHNLDAGQCQGDLHRVMITSPR